MKKSHNEFLIEYAFDLNKFIGEKRDVQDPTVKDSITYQGLTNMKHMKVPGLVLNKESLKLLGEIVGNSVFLKTIDLKRYYFSEELDDKQLFRYLGKSKFLEKVSFNVEATQQEIADSQKANLIKTFKDSHNQEFLSQICCEYLGWKLPSACMIEIVGYCGDDYCSTEFE